MVAHLPFVGSPVAFARRNARAVAWAARSVGGRLTAVPLEQETPNNALPPVMQNFACLVLIRRNNGSYVASWASSLMRLPDSRAYTGRMQSRTLARMKKRHRPGSLAAATAFLAVRARSSNPSIERTSQRPLRALWSAAHVER